VDHTRKAFGPMSIRSSGSSTGAAVAYHGAYRDEIDEWIELNARASEVAHHPWLAGQQALKR
jgi:hypothetical protein